MTYQVLARKWRPRSFAELVGQEHVARPLINALDNDRVHHAFLFTGTRGVGKTTIARIFAKSLNCEQGVGAQPCGECGACRDLDEGRFVDLIEIDAASRTKVEDTRDLLDNVQYAPTRGRYKVYLIDEVHMLSNHSFNALLKTLEEPPPHVKFLLATTDPQRLPITVLSRCLQFNLKRLPAASIAAHLDSILQREGIASEPAALALLARAGDGSMRDALSLLDQAIAFGDGAVRQEPISAMLGLIDQRQVERLLDALAARDAAAALAAVSDYDQQAPDYAALLADMLSWLQRIAVLQQLPDGDLDDGVGDPDALRRLAGALSAEDVQLFYQIGLHGRRDLPLAPEPRGGFEMTLLRMLCFLPDDGTDTNAHTNPHTNATTGTSTAATGGAAAASRPTATPATAPAIATPAAASPVATAPPVHGPSASTSVSAAAPVSASVPAAATPLAPVAPALAGGLDEPWDRLVGRLGLAAMAKQLALNCSLVSITEQAVNLRLEPKHSGMQSESAVLRLQDALQAQLGRPLKVQIELGGQQAVTPAQQQADRAARRRQSAVESIEQDPNVRALRDAFDAEVNLDSITPTD